jgi:hypothetical protein
VELDAVVRGSTCSFAEGTEQIGVEVGYTPNLVVKCRRAIGYSTTSLAKPTGVLAGLGEGTLRRAERTTALTAKDVDW